MHEWFCGAAGGSVNKDTEMLEEEYSVKSERSAYHVVVQLRWVITYSSRGPLWRTPVFTKKEKPSFEPRSRGIQSLVWTTNSSPGPVAKTSGMAAKLPDSLHRNSHDFHQV